MDVAVRVIGPGISFADGCSEESGPVLRNGSKRPLGCMAFRNARAWVVIRRRNNDDMLENLEQSKDFSGDVTQLGKACVTTAWCQSWNYVAADRNSPVAVACNQEGTKTQSLANVVLC
jgi:hypothetical protein